MASPPEGDRRAVRPGDPQRDGRRRIGTPAVPGRRRRQDGRIAAIGRIREAGRGGDRRRGPRGHARLHRRPHPHGRPGVLGPARHLLVLARRHHRGHGQLRLHARALPGADERHLVVRNLERAEDISARRHGRRASTGRGRPSPSTSTPSTGSPRASTTPPTSATPPCAPGPWASGPSSRRPPTTTSPSWRGSCATPCGPAPSASPPSRTPNHETSDDRPVASPPGDVVGGRRPWSGCMGEVGTGAVRDRPGADRPRREPPREEYCGRLRAPGRRAPACRSPSACCRAGRAGPDWRDSSTSSTDAARRGPACRARPTAGSSCR